MKKLTCILLFSCAALRTSGAAEKGTATEPPKPDEAAAAPAIELKNKSSFVLDESGRNPFWPIGWKPTAKISSGGNDMGGSDVSANAFIITSITVDNGTHFAIINGKVMSEGQVFGLQMGNQTYQITVKSIQDGQVVLQRRDQEIRIGLRRK